MKLAVPEMCRTLQGLGRVAIGAVLLTAGHLALGAVAVFLPVQDRTGDGLALEAVEQALRRELSQVADVVDPARTRIILRRLRIRDGDQAAPALLQRLAAELGADWLFSATLHDSERRDVPRLTLSARVYQAETGAQSWAGFVGGSGLDHRTILDLGRIPDVETLAPKVVERITTDLAQDRHKQDGTERRRFGVALGKLAIVPFSGATPRAATSAAEAMTEAARAAAHQFGTQLISPGCVNQTLRRQGLISWGGVDAMTRGALQASCGADTVLTGLVERYDVGGAEREPEPRIAVALRLLDAETGRILWMGQLERRGWDRQSFFRLGRIYSRGALAERMMESLTRNMVQDQARLTRESP